METSRVGLLPVDAWTDFLCPYSFVTSLALRKLRDEFPLEIRWRSIMVRPPGLPPLSPGMRAKGEKARAQTARCALSEYGLELAPGPLELDTLSAHLALKHAERFGLGDKCHLAIMNAYWLEGARIDRPDVLDGIVRRLGLDGKGVPWEDPALGEAVEADIGLAQEHDLYVVPALMFGDHHIVSGAEPYDRLRAVARLASAARAHPPGHTHVQQPPFGPDASLGAMT
jgi:predicted DsbA family dithiol-disulfide isomerase